MRFGYALEVLDPDKLLDQETCEVDDVIMSNSDVFISYDLAVQAMNDMYKEFHKHPEGFGIFIRIVQCDLDGPEEMNIVGRNQ